MNMDGYKFKIIGKQANLKVPFSIDVSTGDIITPRAIEYQYKTILEDNYIKIYAYNYETIIAEKLETILRRNTTNSRMKDYYDLYFFANLKWNEIDKNVLKQAVLTTFNHRKSDYELKNAESILEEIKSSESLIQLWKAYQKKKTYAKDINFENVITAINKILKEIE